MNGILIVKKEAGFTSHDVVAKLRGILHQKKIGHTGTLDPQATGVLPICIGNATKVSSILTDTSKEYEALLRFGLTTDTQDAEGKILSVSADHEQWQDTAISEVNGEESPAVMEGRVSDLTEEKVRQIILDFVGKSKQIPPMFSAKKIDGKKLYELAREGKEVERKPASIEITKITIEEIALPGVRFRVACSKGTYIRTLCHDIGQKAGCGAIMETLLRTRAGIFTLEQAKTLSEIEEIMQKGEIDKALISVDHIFGMYPAGICPSEHLMALQNGNQLEDGWIEIPKEGNADLKGTDSGDTKVSKENDVSGISKDSALAGKNLVRMYDEDGRFYGLYERMKDETIWKPFRMFL